jgi:6-methylsalicylate decarboxylase
MRQYAPANLGEMAPDGIEYALRRLYYDIAGTVYGPAIAALTSLVPTTRILFGSDNPFVPLVEKAPHNEKAPDVEPSGAECETS